MTVEREREARQLLDEKLAEVRTLSYAELQLLPGLAPPKVSMIDRLYALLGRERLRIVDGDPREVEEVVGALGNPYHVVTSPDEQEDDRIHVAVLVIDAGFSSEQLADLRTDLFIAPDGSVVEQSSGFEE